MAEQRGTDLSGIEGAEGRSSPSASGVTGTAHSTSADLRAGGVLALKAARDAVGPNVAEGEKVEAKEAEVSNAIWDQKVELLAQKTAFLFNPRIWYDHFWFDTHHVEAFLKAAANEAHVCIGLLCDIFGSRVKCITQNVDGLHSKGGCPERQLIQVHGQLGFYRCSDDDCIYGSEKALDSQSFDFWDESEELRHLNRVENRVAAVPSFRDLERTLLKAYGLPAGSPLPAGSSVPAAPSMADSPAESPGDSPGPGASHSKRGAQQEVLAKNNALVPCCPACRAVAMPLTLLFDEFYDTHRFFQFEEALDWIHRADVLVFCGTSFAVHFTDRALELAELQAKTVFNINTNRDDAAFADFYDPYKITPPNLPAYKHELTNTATGSATGTATTTGTGTAIGTATERDRNQHQRHANLSALKADPTQTSTKSRVEERSIIVDFDSSSEDSHGTPPSSNEMDLTQSSTHFTQPTHPARSGLQPRDAAGDKGPDPNSSFDRTPAAPTLPSAAGLGGVPSKLNDATSGRVSTGGADEELMSEGNMAGEGNIGSEANMGGEGNMGGDVGPGQRASPQESNMDVKNGDVKKVDVGSREKEVNMSKGSERESLRNENLLFTPDSASARLDVRHGHHTIDDRRMHDPSRGGRPSKKGATIYHITKPADEVLMNIIALRPALEPRLSSKLREVETEHQRQRWRLP